MSLFVEGKPVPNPPTSIRLFNLMDNMKWAHLPVAGGLFDQSPQFIEETRYIFQERNAYQAEQQRKQEAEQKRNSGSGRVAGRRR